MNKKKKLLILYDWFYPGFRAGGPIQSLTNLALAIQKEFDIYVLTSAYDINSTVAYTDTELNNWNEVNLGSNSGVKVFYAEKGFLVRKTIKKILLEIIPHTIYFNGLFSYRFFMLPLAVIAATSKKYKIVICPRGMLKHGALAGKPLKKRLYLGILRYSGLLKQVWWHATTNEEANDIRVRFPINKGIITAPNIPKAPVTTSIIIPKQKGQLKLVSLSLINEHKNIYLLLQLIAAAKLPIELDIYGPIIEKSYWKKCEELMKGTIGKVEYKGVLNPQMVQSVLTQYHALILLTKGENFGHSIYETFSVGRPVITTHFTPWNSLKDRRAGVNLDLNNKEECLHEIRAFFNLEQEEFNNYCLGAHHLAVEYYKGVEIETSYSRLFS